MAKFYSLNISKLVINYIYIYISEQKYAMKAIKKSSLTKDRHIRRAKDERLILEKIKSPFIVKYL